jgi:hypothetical protein
MRFQYGTGNATYGLNNHWSHGDVGDKVSIHDIDLDASGTGFINCAYLLAQSCKISG